MIDKPLNLEELQSLENREDVLTYIKQEIVFDPRLQVNLLNLYNELTEENIPTDSDTRLFTDFSELVEITVNRPEITSAYDLGELIEVDWRGW